DESWPDPRGGRTLAVVTGRSPNDSERRRLSADLPGTTRDGEVAQLDLLDLGAVGARRGGERVDREDPDRHLVAGQAGATSFERRRLVETAAGDHERDWPRAVGPIDRDDL